MTSNILVNINEVTPASSSGSWANITDMAASGITVQGTNSVLLLMAQVQLNPAGDNTAEFRFYVNGSEVNSPVITAFSDTATNEEANSMTLLWAITGLSGSSNSFSVQWKTITGSPAVDTARNRTFQILEIVGGDAEILVDSGTAGQIGDPGSWGNLFQSTDITIAGTSSVILMLANVPYNMEGDESTDFQFGVDNSGEGAVTTVYTDSPSEGNGWSGMHVLDSLSAGLHSFELKWQARTGAGQTDATRRRTFQVVEITANAALKLDLISSAPDSAGGWANVAGLSSSYNVASTAAIHLLIANMVQAGDSSDSTADYSIGVDGTNEGAELIGMADSASIVQRICMTRLKTGLSAASHSFQLRWLEIAGATAADTGRPRTFFAIEFTQANVIDDARRAVVTVPTYKLEGVTYDKDAVVLGSVECYLYKDDLDNTITPVDYVLSNAGTGAYSFVDINDNDANYFVVAFKDDTPTVMDVTDHVLQPTVAGAQDYHLYLRSDVDKGEVSPDNDLRLRSDADKVGAEGEVTRRAEVTVFAAVTADDTRRAEVIVVRVIDDTRRAEVLAAFSDEETRRAEVLAAFGKGETRRAEVLAAFEKGETREASITVATTLDDVRRSEVAVATTKGETRRAEVLAAFSEDYARRASVTHAAVIDDVRRATITHAVVNEPVRRAIVVHAGVNDPARRGEITAAVSVDDVRRATLNVAGPKDEWRRSEVAVAVSVDDVRRAVIYVVRQADETRRATVTHVVVIDDVREAVIYAAKEADETRGARVVVGFEDEATRRAEVLAAFEKEAYRRSEVTVAVTVDDVRRAEVLAAFEAEATRRAEIFVPQIIEDMRRAEVLAALGAEVTREARVTVAGATDDFRRAEVTIAVSVDNTRRATVAHVAMGDVERRASVSVLILIDDVRRAQVTVVMEVEITRRAIVYLAVSVDEIRRSSVSVIELSDTTRRAEVYVYGAIPAEVARRAQVIILSGTDSFRRSIIFVSIGRMDFSSGLHNKEHGVEISVSNRDTMSTATTNKDSNMVAETTSRDEIEGRARAREVD